MHEYSIRPFCSADWPGVEKILTEAVAEGNATFRSRVPAFDEWNKSHYPFARLTAQKSGLVAAWAALSYMKVGCSSEGLGEVSIYIAQEHQRRGLGRKLLLDLRKEAFENGLWTLHSVIMSDNIPSIELHKNCGFRIVGECEKISKDISGKWRNIIIMESRHKEND
ncbi:MAG: GNAT family N-acetyltransferase [Oscillospiraceae bacterium]|jgi:phosphinothricin acetyltransferase|nr:GNAT family N-acetyltransferase [Oscillospiraceae bacterium]